MSYSRIAHGVYAIIFNGKAWPPSSNSQSACGSPRFRRFYLPKGWKDMFLMNFLLPLFLKLLPSSYLPNPFLPELFFFLVGLASEIDFFC